MSATETRNGFEARREKLLDLLLELGGQKSINDGDPHQAQHRYSNRIRWQRYMACLARGVHLDEANAYFETSPDIVPEEWHTMCYLRTYLQFKDGVLSPRAAARLADTLAAYRENRFHAPGARNPECHGTNGNHSIVAFSFYLLADQVLGAGPKHDLAREKFIDWVQYHGRYGRDEVNSPHYLDRSFLPLLNLCDYAEDAELRLWARMAIDKMVVDWALLSLKNVRGGPWCRAYQNLVPGVAEHTDGSQNAFHVMGYQFFGGSPLPSYLMTDQILSYAFLATTAYRPPRVACLIADSEARGVFEVKSYRRANARPHAPYADWDMYYYMTPAFSLSALQDRIELDNDMNGGKAEPKDWVNTQVWELTFSHPTKKLGPKRDLTVGVGGPVPRLERDNPNTANMQYGNVLFYKGEIMDYNGNLAADGGTHACESGSGRAFEFWRVAVPEGDVYVGRTHFPAAAAGILEVGMASEYAGFQAFVDAVKGARASCQDTGKHTSYTSTKGDLIRYANPSGRPGEGHATLNGRPLALHDYPHYDSPWMRAERETGVIWVNKDGAAVLLDFSNRSKPVREEEGVLQ
ncbi:MAG: hypothetical protein JXR37_20390 [Kiritimatiellae bacterium]|nr:hypothetical protein [Kiritimatiellia bacterium]